MTIFLLKVSCIIALGLTAYLNSLSNGFVWDDILIVVQNDLFKGFRLLPEIVSRSLFYLTSPESPYYRPVQGVSYALDFYASGLAPWGYHLTNVLLHVAVALLVFLLLRKVSGDGFVPFFSACAFAVHPLHTSVVGYISSRGDILYALFGLSSLLFLLKAKKPAYFFYSYLCFTLALFSKEAALVLPLLFALVQLAYLRQAGTHGPLRLALVYAGYAAICGIYLAARANVVASGFTQPITGSFGLGRAALTLPFIALEYLRLAVVPAGLHVYRTIDVATLSLGAFLLTLTGMAVLLTAWRCGKKVFFALSWSLILSLPIVFVAFRYPEFYRQHKAAVAESWFYLPLVGVCVIAGYVLEEAGRRVHRALTPVAAVLVIIALSAATVIYNRGWKDNRTLFAHSLRYVKNSPTLFRDMGWVLLQEGKTEEAVDAYRNSLGLPLDAKREAVITKDLAYALFVSGEPDESERILQRLTDLHYNYADAHACLGVVRYLHDAAAGMEEWRLALEIDPFNAVSFSSLLQLSRNDAAVRDYLLAKYLAPEVSSRGFQSYRVHRSLGLVYLYAKEYAQAEMELKKADRLNPYDIFVHNALGVLYAESGDLRAAERHFRAALRLNPFHSETYRNLALFYEQNGDTAMAQKTRQEAGSKRIFD